MTGTYSKKKYYFILSISLLNQVLRKERAKHATALVVHIFVTLYDFWERHIGHNVKCHRNLDRPCGLVLKLYQFVLL